MPKDAPVRWENTELIKILGYINNNFDTWSTNHLSSCLKAIEATNNKRDAKAVYNKLHSLIKAYEEFTTTGKKAPTCSIIWDEPKIHDLVRKIYIKTGDRKKKDEQEKKKKDDQEKKKKDDNQEKKKKDDNQEKKKKDGSQEPKERKKKENKEINNRDDNVDDGDVEMANCSDPATPIFQSTVNGHVSQIPFSAELVEKLYSEKRQEIAELRTKLIKQAESTNSYFESVNYKVPVPIEPIDKSCNEKIDEITRLRDELLELVEKTNTKYNQLKEFK